ncbi:MAG TPA: GGDEF domain-containing protein [Acidobacteriota bacterium]|nr:GGDEF domain-containing protein [Acidobacteriota bacterium]
MPTIFFEKRIWILWLHWSVVALTLAVLHFGDPVPGFSPNNWLILLLLGVHFALTLSYWRRSKDVRWTFLLVISNILGPCLAVWMSNPPNSAFYILLFLLLIVVAAFSDLNWQAAGGVLLALCYPVMVALSGEPLQEVHWLSVLLLIGCGLYCGYLANLQRGYKDKVHAGTVYTEGLFEFGDTISSLDGLDAEARIPRLVAAIMGADNCELALIEGNKIVRRFLPGHHCREYVDIEINQSVHDRAILSADVFASTAMQEDPGFTQKKDFALYHYRSYLGKHWPIQQGRSCVMALFSEKKHNWSEYSKKQFRFLVGQSVMALRNASLRAELECQARTDGLTELANHRYFYERFEDELARASRMNHHLSLLLIDLDHFKKINDGAGHRVGDQVLQALSEILRSNIRRQVDLAGRLGGDEFAIVLPETGSRDALVLCRRLLEAAARRKVGDLSGFSLSIGCATFPEDGETLSEIVEHADQALYRSKHLGRGRASLYSEVLAETTDASASNSEIV